MLTRSIWYFASPSATPISSRGSAESFHPPSSLQRPAVFSTIWMPALSRIVAVPPPAAPASPHATRNGSRMGMMRIVFIGEAGAGKGMRIFYYISS
jgi:hypothetical protein